MPQAVSWDELYKFEDYVESAAQAILSIDGVRTYIQRNEDDIATPSVGVQFSVGPALEHYGLRALDGQPFLDAWTGRLTFAIATKRSKNNSHHSGIRASIRRRMQKIALWTTALMPYHQITQIIEAGTSPNLVDEKLRDISEISFSVFLNIREDAWPDATP